MRTYGERELLTRGPGKKAWSSSVSGKPNRRVEEADGRLKITVKDQVLERPVSFMVDLLTWPPPLFHNNAPLAELYKVPLNAEVFSPRPTPRSSRWSLHRGHLYGGAVPLPKPMQESWPKPWPAPPGPPPFCQRVFADGVHHLDSHRRNCDGCAFCVDTCPFQAITLLEYMKGGDIKKTVEVNPIQCKAAAPVWPPAQAGIYVAGFTRNSWKPRWTRPSD